MTGDDNFIGRSENLHAAKVIYIIVIKVEKVYKE
jgi:hypothetical protein